MRLRSKRTILFLLVLVCLVTAVQPGRADAAPPSFVLITHGFWGSMDNLPSGGQAWLASSPYPHYRKHQEAAFLNGPDYRPIPQALLRFSEGPGLARPISQPYARMERELAYWARVLNERVGWERVRIFPDWQVLQDENAPPGIGEINIIYWKFDWRLEFPQIARDYAGPLLSFLGQRWPGARIHLVGHSLGGSVGRYVASCYPGRLTSLVTVGAPHYGLYEVGRQGKGGRTSYGGDSEKEYAQAFGLWATERVFFGTRIIQLNRDFLASAAEFTRCYIPGARWMDPESGLLGDGFGHLAKLSEAVPCAIALYGLGHGSYDLQGIYHREVYEGRGVGPGLGPEGGPPAYALTGDGRVDPVSARGPFVETLCLGKEMTHGDLMWSPLVLTAIFDWYLFGGAMPRTDIWTALRRLGVEWGDREQRITWLMRAREDWGDGPAMIERFQH